MGLSANLFVRLAAHPNPVHLWWRPRLEGALRAHEPVVLRRRRRLGSRGSRRGERVRPEGIRPVGRFRCGARGGAKCSGEGVIGRTVELFVLKRTYLNS